tara:strand:- start:411 stop:581 length:171 start_codon:yes stop_codon:yes gene_type:complete
MLLPLALFISLLDNKILKGFLSSGKSIDHYGYIGILVIAVVVLIYIIIQFDKKSNS